MSYKFKLGTAEEQASSSPVRDVEVSDEYHASLGLWKDPGQTVYCTCPHISFTLTTQRHSPMCASYVHSTLIIPSSHTHTHTHTHTHGSMTSTYKPSARPKTQGDTPKGAMVPSTLPQAS